MNKSQPCSDTKMMPRKELSLDFSNRLQVYEESLYDDLGIMMNWLEAEEVKQNK